jgi:phytoene desaturase
MAMGFQAKYLGMSPWECPGAFSILSYTEHAFGVFHPMGGVHKISEKMADIVLEYGGKIDLGTPVKNITMENGKATGVLLEDGGVLSADYVIMNADFAYGMKTLISEKDRPSYTNAKLFTMKYSCSTFMLYLCLDKKYDIPHHNVIFGADYKRNVDEIFGGKGMPTDPAFYLHNPSVMDPSLAPEGCSTLYVLVPVSNLQTPFAWEEKKREFRDMLVKMIEEKTELTDLSAHIKDERIITPLDWKEKLNVENGATFNLAHNLGQMLYLRPHNRFNDIKNLYLVGGGTHPGSGLPTILESGRIAAKMIAEAEQK